MTNRTRERILILVLAAGLAACNDGSPSSPTAPSTVQEPAPVPAPTRAVFPPGVLSAITLSGVVFEVTTTGRTPIDGVSVYCELCGEATHSWSFTDSNGTYSFTGVWTTPGVRTPVWFHKDAYADPPGVPPFFNESGYRQVMVNGDTRFDVELVRR